MTQTRTKGETQSAEEGWSLDVAVVAGLLAKVRQLSSQPGHVVKAPPSTYAYKADHLRFSAKQPTYEQKVTYAEFSRLVNRLPEGTPSGWKHAGFLWDIYGTVLNAKLAKSDLTPQEQTSYDEARKYLYTESSEPSEHLKDYRKYRDAYFHARLAYSQGEQAAKNSHDPKAIKQWKEVDEPRLAAARNDALSNWESLGHKEKVEEYLQTLASLGAKSPAQEWGRFRKAFDPARLNDWSTAPNGSKYAVSPFSPGDEVLDKEWPRLRVGRQEFLELLKSGGSGIDPSSVDLRITSFAFDHCPVDVVRPWFEHPMTMFGSRAWKWWRPEEEAPLSDGGAPPTGRCPAYVESVALTRNITVYRTVTGRESDAAHAGVPELPLYSAPVDGRDEEEIDIRHTGRQEWGNGYALSMETGLYQHRDNGWETRTDWWLQIEKRGNELWYTVNLAPSVRWGFLPPEAKYEDVTYQDLKKVHFGRDELQFVQGSVLSEGYLLAATTRSGDLVKWVFSATGEDWNPKIRWTTYSKASHQSTAPETIYLAALKCRLLPKSPDPDPNLPWG
ncbi:hypothetical protein [Streptomyces sp. NPDC017991]|uniref:hypothetical protein n=1 Tax=Streptomyces sp. NPDC017991 TaxID=3365026 RepID=UPI00378E5DCF